MNRYLDDCQEEMKRIEHLIYVSLKYTRTVDVIKSIIDRFITVFDLCFLGMLEEHEENIPSREIPKSPGLRACLIQEKFKNEPEFLEFIELYHHLRELKRAEFKRSREYRRHVTMTAFLQSGPAEITIDTIMEYYKRIKIFTYVVKNMLEREEDAGEQDISEMIEKTTRIIESERW